MEYCTMTLDFFNKLTLEQKAETVWEWGFFITNRKSGDDTVAVFLMSDFFVELHISSKSNETTEVKGLTKAGLKPEILSKLKDNLFLKANTIPPTAA